MTKPKPLGPETDQKHAGKIHTTLSESNLQPLILED